MEEKITLARYKNVDFTVNYEKKKYVWAGAKGTVVSKKQVSSELVDWLMSFTTTFVNGDLVIVNNEDKSKEVEENMTDIDEFKANSMTKEEVSALLKGNYKKLESELNKITSDSTKRFILEVAKEIKLESAPKQKLIKDMMGSGLTIEDLFFE